MFSGFFVSEEIVRERRAKKYAPKHGDFPTSNVGEIPQMSKRQQRALRRLPKSPKVV
jgi:hypothetical protein